MAAAVLALAIGETELVAGLVGGSWQVHGRYRRPLPTASADEAWDAVQEAIERLRGDEPVAGVGIGCAGPVDVLAGTVSPVGMPCWQEFPLRTRVSALLPDLPVQLASDGVCMAEGEHRAGAARESENLLFMAVSTGVRGGLVLAGVPYQGRTGNAGNIGHVVVEPDGAPCRCGGRGCLDTVAPGPAMVRWARVAGWQAPEYAHAEHLAAAALMDDEVAKTTFARAGGALGRAIAGIAAVCDLDLVVVGGAVARSGSLLFDPLRAALARHLRLPHLAGLLVVPAALGGDAALIGAASLVQRWP